MSERIKVDRPVWKKIFYDGRSPNARLILTIKSKNDFDKTFSMLNARQMEIKGTPAELLKLVEFIKKWK